MFQRTRVRGSLSVESGRYGGARVATRLFRRTELADASGVRVRQMRARVQYWTSFDFSHHPKEHSMKSFGKGFLASVACAALFASLAGAQQQRLAIAGRVTERGSNT